jgi:hypothetical protein
MNDNLRIEKRPIAALLPYARNARTHSEAQIAQIAASMVEFGWTNPVLMDGSNGIIAGHGRVLAARKLGLAQVPVIELVHLSENQKRAYILADNKIALNAGWDEDMLRIELDALREADFNLALTGFDTDELKAFFDCESDAAGCDPSEGDPVALAMQRAVTFVNRKVLMVSTPIVKGFSRIEAAYEESDKRVFAVPCDHCGVFSQLFWRDIRWPENRMREAAWHCPHCGGVHPEHRKPALLAHGRWQATTSGDGRTAGFHLSSLYSPWVTWAEIAEEHRDARDDPVRLKVWVNTKLAETWEERDGERMDEESLMARREQYGPAIPAEVAVLTCGVDVQDDRLEIELVGWGRDEEAWSCDYKIIWGDPAAPALWHELEQYLAATFEHETLADGLPVHAACLDTGGHHTQAAYAFCRGRERQRIWAIKGLSGKRPIWPKRPTKAAKGEVNLFGIGVDAAKEAVFARLRKQEYGAGFCHFPLDRDAAYFEHLTAERLRTRYVKGFANSTGGTGRTAQRSPGLPGLCLRRSARAAEPGAESEQAGRRVAADTGRSCSPE